MISSPHPTPNISVVSPLTSRLIAILSNPDCPARAISTISTTRSAASRFTGRSGWSRSRSLAKKLAGIPGSVNPVPRNFATGTVLVPKSTSKVCSKR